MKKKNSSILNTIVFLCLSFSAGAVAAPHPTVNVYVRVTTPEGHPPTGIRLRPLVTAINGSFSVLEPLLLEDGKFYNELAFNDYWLDWTGPDGISQEYSLELKAASH